MAAVAGSPSGYFDPFSAAEAAGLEVIEQILEEGGQRLYDSYIERKSFKFAATSASEVLVGELKMCFVRFDEGPLRQSHERGVDVSIPSMASDCTAAEPEVFGGGSWSLEMEPPRCRIDTWARSCVPVKKKLVRPKSVQQPETQRATPRGRGVGRLQAPGHGSSCGSRSPSRSGPLPIGDFLETGSRSGSTTANPLRQLAMPVDVGKTSSMGGTLKQQAIPIVDEREDDEEEAVLREMKDREARRRREEEVRLQRKAAEDADQAARLAQVKDQMKNKPYTYDSSGNIIWVQPPSLQRLPSSNPAPSYTCKEQRNDDEFRKSANTSGMIRTPASGPGAGVRKVGKRSVKDADFVDSFKKFASQQPSMVEAMQLKPGVQLEERGRHKSGPDPSRGNLLTRKVYESMVTHENPKTADPESGEAGLVEEGAHGIAAHDRAAAAGSLYVASVADASGGFGGSSQPADPGRGALSSRDRIETVPPPPSAMRPIQPVPPAGRRGQLKRDALGFNSSSRERMAKGNMSRFPNCAAQPPLGATMGHGLHPHGQTTEEYYFPLQPAQPTGRGEGDMSGGGGGDADDVASSHAAGSQFGGAAPLSSSNGAILQKNPEIARRLFMR
eukprot:TRINITY_DN11589_c0_g1_i1.p1 TRINITY_DN11589_c0_g1~~TRINITY_DN11589_c0_g1_i1.p1  ORF type:complete len:621 (-),score=115.46 TRINITY_DN11589_c0_g1_i1:343-2184(-)